MNENHLKETPIPAEAAAAEPAFAPKNGKEKLSHKERKARWKAAQAARRQELEDYYQRSVRARGGPLKVKCQ